MVCFLSRMYQPAYHSSFNNLETKKACGCFILPLKTKVKGPAPSENNAEQDDVIDEVLKYFKANVLFRKFQIEDGADRVLIYLTVYVHQCLLRLERKNVQNRGEADKVLFSLAQERFALPGESDFVLGGFFPKPENATEKSLIEGFLKQAREETGLRLLDKIFVDGPTQPPSKYWMQFARHKFLNKAFEN
ncbi:actin-related protein 2/3 complex subunit 3 [Acrasis kona]|uniref:Actin-related protein 2/3 complex subunit 3 n=1 Tax=Acrasis kona TaxID=1008807 RepID=A0AAW2Z2U8_9EUKA